MHIEEVKDFTSVNETHNIYILRVSNIKGSLVKLGYSTDLKKRLRTYYYCNPLVELLGTYYREDAKEFEFLVHKSIKAEVLNEWYSGDKLNLLLDLVAGKKVLDYIPTTAYPKGFKPLFDKYTELRESTKGTSPIIKQLEQENPLFAEIYNKLGIKGVRSAKYNEKVIKEKLYASEDKTLELIYKAFFNVVETGVFISNKEAKAKLTKIYKTFKITSIKPTTTMLNACEWFKLEKRNLRITGKQTAGFTIELVK